MNEYFTEEELAKLPKWAQQRITTLEANKKYYKNQVAEMIGKGKAGSNVTVDISEEYNLPNNSDVVFWINCEKRDGISLFSNSAIDDPSELRISATGTTRLVIKPISSNVIVVTTKR